LKINFAPFSVADVIGFVTDPHLSFTFSQEGEDLLLEELFQDKAGAPGFYVDVGAHHPKRFSNTYCFYMRGWTGINIDATPGSMAAFREQRPKDINLELGIGADEAELTFFLFGEPALNTFDAERAAFLESSTAFRIADRQSVPVRRLATVLAEHAGDRAIDFLSVDTEGFDLAVVKSNDWEKFRPRIVLLEDLATDLLALAETDLCRFMLSQDYRPIVKLPRSVIYRDGRVTS